MRQCERPCFNGQVGDEHPLGGCPEDDRFKTELCNEQPCPYIEECDDFDACSVTCDGGLQSCQRNCKNGAFGEEGCPSENKTRIKECNTQVRIIPS